ncbi:MAG: phosphate acyltransferase [Proteobacteria bacterium]|nr:phosphate acyltransferase [Pseudomonadota bacterium]
MLLSSFVTPLVQQCQGRPKVVLLPEGNDDRTIEAANILVDLQSAKTIILIGDEATITPKLSPTLKSGLGGILKIQAPHDQKIVALTTFRCRNVLQAKGKNPDEQTLVSLATNPLYQAGAMLSQGLGDCAVAGSVATTSEVIRAALGTVGLKEGFKTLSGSFFMHRDATNHLGGKFPGDLMSQPHETFLYADSGVVVDPTEDQLADIAASSCETWSKIMTTPPVVAFLSFSTKGSARHMSSDKMSIACQKFRLRFPDIISDGELQFDAAYDLRVGARKAPGSVVPGRANIFIFPDLNSGNIAYKVTQRLGQFSAFGPILQGLAKPYSDLSRGASAIDIAVSVLINSSRE